MSTSDRTPIALLGGTFDPVHYGHLRLADDVRRGLGLAELRLVPAADPPHRGGPHSSAAHRLAMLRIALEEFPGLIADDRELQRGGKSFTVLTLEELRHAFPERPLWLIVGADAFRGLPTWHRWRELFTLAHVVVVARPGVPPKVALPPLLADEWQRRHTLTSAPLFATPAGRIFEQRVTPQPISATDIRALLAQQRDGETLSQLLPQGVLAYIEQHHLYHAPTDAT
ncbi:MAG: nicotinate-nucleotide adenylyltransferase [Betaproteobacteria bacterium]